MIYGDELQTGAESLLESVINSPRLLSGVTAATTSLSIANAAQFLQGALVTAGIIAGLLATILLSRLHWIKYKNEVINNKILTAQLASMGAEPITEKLP